jgi:ABC-type enterochelin transport system substrate-binding protein
MTKRIAYPLALAGALALGACSGQKAEQAASDQAAVEPTEASSEFVAQNPSEAAVPVNLPTTAMTNAPASEAAPAASAAPAKQ